MPYVDMKLTHLAIIIGALAGIALVFIIIAIYCVCISRKRHQLDIETEPVNNVVVNIKSQKMDDSDLSLDSNTLKKHNQIANDARSLSPVQSWGASTLLQEHERRLSVNSYHAVGIPEVTYQPEGDDLYPSDSNFLEKEKFCMNHNPPYDPPPYTTFPCDELRLRAELCSDVWDSEALPPPSVDFLQIERKRRNVTQV